MKKFYIEQCYVETVIFNTNLRLGTYQIQRAYKLTTLSLNIKTLWILQFY